MTEGFRTPDLRDHNPALSPTELRPPRTPDIYDPQYRVGRRKRRRRLDGAPVGSRTPDQRIKSGRSGFRGGRLSSRTLLYNGPRNASALHGRSVRLDPVTIR